MTPKLEKIRVKDLFGYLSYELSDLNSERAIFVIGNNGSGKSTIFRLIEALVQRRWHTFHEVVFSEISFSFVTDDEKVTYNFRKNQNVEWQDELGEWYLLVQSSVREYLELDSQKLRAEWIFNNDSNVNRASCGRHWSIPGKRHMRDIELIKYWEVQNLKPEDHDLVELGDATHPNMERINSVRVQFIQANRLLALESQSDAENGERYYREKKKRNFRQPIYQISDLLREKIRSQITRAFIQRDTIGNTALNAWLSQGNASLYEGGESVHQLAARIDEIESSFSQFSRNASPTKLLIPEKLPEGYEPFLKFYLGSRLKQLSPLTDFLEQIDLFSEICNSAFGYKEVSLHDQRGLTVNVNIGSHCEALDLSDLSSGEQQIIFLAYQLTIGADHNALILIDEPELSLHLEWQKTFTSLLTRIGEQTNNNYLCATHSPAIVGNRVSALRNIEVDNEE